MAVKNSTHDNNVLLNNYATATQAQNNKGLLTQVKMSQIFFTSANGVSQRRALRAR